MKSVALPYEINIFQNHIVNFSRVNRGVLLKSRGRVSTGYEPLRGGRAPRKKTYMNTNAPYCIHPYKFIFRMCGFEFLPLTLASW